MSDALFYINGTVASQHGNSEQSSEVTLHPFSELAERKLSEAAASYPDKKSAVMSGLYLAQEELGVVDQRAVDWVASRLNMSPMQVWEVATFYTMFYKKPVGKYHVQVCRTLSCAVRGAKKITEYVAQRLKTSPGEITESGTWSFEEVECLGSCGTAPMCQINSIFFENLSPDSLEEIMDRIEADKPDLSLSTLRDQLGDGLMGAPKSRVR